MDKWLSPFSVRPKLLIVDDQVTNIRILHELFRETCDVFMATTGERAVEQCSQQLPDLVLLDIVMDAMNGFDVCRLIKADPATRHIPVIFVTGKDRVEDEVMGFELGAADFVTKPYNPTLVRARVKTHLMLKLQSDLLLSMALVDGLTGVGNRRRLDEFLSVSWRQCQRDQRPISLIMADIDFFKRYNDHYGHPAGDGCLRQVAQTLDASINRPNDLLCRYGGEEFACVLPNTDREGALSVAEKMLASVRGLRIPHASSTVDDLVTLSIGIATLIPTPDMAVETLLTLGDENLYRAKTTGRARIVAL